MKSEKDEFRDMGLVWYKTHFAWGWKHGRLRWAPHWVRNLIMSIWNPVGCLIWGHDTFGPILEGEEETLPDGRRIRYKARPKVCVNCCKEFK